jgi:peptidoglycan L-alanyl-D-glutamate endopeptidase CwlK
MSQPLFEHDVVFLQRVLKSGGLYTGAIDGIWGPKTDAAVKAFESQSKQIAATYGTFDLRSEGNIHTLQLKAQATARVCLKTLLDAGLDAKIISGTRSYAEQDALYRQGRFGNPGSKVTNARGGQSNHNFGIAWDIALFKGGAYLTISAPYQEAAKKVLSAGIPGLEWGGSWKTFKDLPHYQLATGLSITAVRQKFEQGQPYF